MKRPLVGLIAVLIIVASVISIYLTQRQIQPRINLAPFIAMGEVTALETVKVLGNRGRVVVIVMEQPGANIAAIDAPLKSFQKTLEASPGITIAGTEKLKFDPAEPYGFEMGLPLQKYLEWIEKYPSADAFVSFVGAPMIMPAEMKHVPQKVPKFIAVATAPMRLKSLFADGILTVAITPRFTPQPQQAGEPKTPQEWFERYYMVVTADNAKEVLAQMPE